MPILLYIPCSSFDEAKMIARTLLAEKLIACANILPHMQSIYIWQGDVQESQEVVLLLKTHSDKENQARERIAALHSYDVPCIATFKIDGLNPAFAKWMAESFA